MSEPRTLNLITTVEAQSTLEETALLALDTLQEAFKKSHNEDVSVCFEYNGKKCYVVPEDDLEDVIARFEAIPE
jgi:hypothetical protein